MPCDHQWFVVLLRSMGRKSCNDCRSLAGESDGSEWLAFELVEEAGEKRTMNSRPTLGSHLLTVVEPSS